MDNREGLNEELRDPRAHEIATKEAKRRKAKGICSSITAVISEAVINEYGEAKNG